MNESCRLLKEMFKDAEQYQRKIYKIHLNDKEGLIKLLYEAEEIFYDLTYPKLLKKIHNFNKLYQERVRSILEHLGVNFGLVQRNWDQLILKFIALTSQSMNEDEQLCLLQPQTSMLIYTLFSTNVFYSDKLEYQKFLLQYFMRYLSGDFEHQMEKYDFYNKNFNQGISGIYLKTEKQFFKLQNSLKRFQGKNLTPSQLDSINAALDKGEDYLNKAFQKVINVAQSEIQEEFFGTFQFYKDIVKKKQNIHENQQQEGNQRGTLKDSDLVKNFKNFQLFENVSFPLEPNQQDNFINYFQKLIDTAVIYGDYIIKKIKITPNNNTLRIKTNNNELIKYEQQLFDLLLKKDYENHLKDYQFQQVHNQAMINLLKRNVMMAYKSFLKWKYEIKDLKVQYNRKGRVLTLRNYELEQIFFNLSKQINEFFSLNKNPSKWTKDQMYDDESIKNSNIDDEEIHIYFQQRRQRIVDQQKSVKNKLHYAYLSQKQPNYFKTFLFYNQRILTDKPLEEILEIQRDILHEQKSSINNSMKISNLLINNYTESFFFLSKISKQIKNENPKTTIKKVLLKLHKAGSLIEFSAETILNKIFTFLDDAIVQLAIKGLSFIILKAVQEHCRNNNEQVPEKISEINLVQRVDAWLLPVTKWFRENEIIDDRVLKEVEEYQNTMHDKLHKRLLRFRVENFDYDKRYFESNDKLFNDFVISNFLTEKLRHSKTEKPHYVIQLIL